MEEDFQVLIEHFGYEFLNLPLIIVGEDNFLSAHLPTVIGIGYREVLQVTQEIRPLLLHIHHIQFEVDLLLIDEELLPLFGLDPLLNIVPSVEYRGVFTVRQVDLICLLVYVVAQIACDDLESLLF
jgi:hypothetical protein